jgi:MoaA/NifB/PqqE/SkfB family radical SAM enzyme
MTMLEYGGELVACPVSQVMDGMPATIAPDVADRKANSIDIKEKLNQETVQQFIRAVDWQGSSVAPFVVELDPTTRCNLSCPECISGALLNQGEISVPRIKTLVEELIEAKVRAVILIGGGEPLMHPAIEWVIRTLGEAGVHVGITTNGLYIKKHLDVIARHAKWVRVSMDAGTAETFNKLRPSRQGKSLFDATLDNMRVYAKVKQGKLGYSFMVYSEGDHGFKGVPVAGNVKALTHIKSNAGEIFRAAQIARDIGCDYFEVKPMYDVNHFSVLQKEAIADIVEEQIALAKGLETESFRVVEAVKLRATLRGMSNLEPKDYARCAVSQLRTLVTPSGVYVCPYFRGVADKRVGDIANMSFSDMWHGARREEVMRRLNPSVDCPMHCIRHESNLAIEQAIKEGFHDTVDDYDFFI